MKLWFVVINVRGCIICYIIALALCLVLSEIIQNLILIATGLPILSMGSLTPVTVSSGIFISLAILECLIGMELSYLRLDQRLLSQSQAIVL